MVFGLSVSEEQLQAVIQLYDQEQVQLAESMMVEQRNSLPKRSCCHIRNKIPDKHPDVCYSWGTLGLLLLQELSK